MIQTDHELNRKMDNFLKDYDFEVDDELIYAELYEYLANKSTYSALQYRFLCWLGKKLNKPVKVTLPFTSEVKALSLDRFKKKYLYSGSRNALFTKLSDYIADLKIRHRIGQPLEVLVGGSFTDTANDSPNDIDVVILLPEKYKNNPSINEVLERVVGNKIPSGRSEEHTSELQSCEKLVCRLLLEKNNVI